MTSSGRLLRSTGRVAVIGTVGLFLALLVYGVVTKAPSTTIDDSLAQSKPVAAPGFELALLERGQPEDRLGRRLAEPFEDERLALDELRGTPVVLNFWASWCIPCREEAPRLERTWRKVRAEGVLLLGLNMQDITEDARAFIREFELSFPHVRDPTNRAARRWGVTGIPETFFIRRDGKIVGHVVGAISQEQLRAGVRAARSGLTIGALDGGDQRPTR